MEASTRAQYARAFAYVRPYWPRLLVVLLVGLVATLTGLAQPYLSKYLIDEALVRRDWNALWIVAGAMIAVTIAGFLLNILSSYQYVRASAAILFDMRLELYRHLQRMSPRFWAQRRLGDVVSRINNDVAEVQRVSADSILTAFSNIVFFAGSAAIMIALDWRLFLVSVATIPISAWAIARMQVRMTRQVRDVRERSADIGSFLLETLLGARLVAVSVAEQREVARFAATNSRFVDALLRMQVTSFLAAALPGAVVAIATAALFLYGGKRVIDGAITMGTLVAVLAYHARLLAPVQGMLGLYQSLLSAGVSLGRLFELLDVPVEVQQMEGAVRLPGVVQNISLQNVSFRYEQDYVLKHATLEIPAGKITAIVGPSGSGKSTLADLLLRFYDPEAGHILIDGTPLTQISLSDLRSRIALVDQAAYLMHASVRENIAYATPGATFEQIQEAARLAAIHDRVMAMPRGYDTLVGERGLALSAGERQRITIARALLREPSVLLLDEPTTALDPETELSLSETLRSLFQHELKGRTAIVITHRAALARIADQVVTLEGGQLRVEENVRS
jgi:ATP-binding cassette subfamily B protein